jgi:uncharacterized protein (TIGR02246 family)
MPDTRRAMSPAELVGLFVEHANAGDLEGLVGLYEPDAVLAAGEPVARGRDQIREFYRDLLARRSSFPAVEPAFVAEAGDLAVTITDTGKGRCSVEVVRRQADGTWLWAIDQLKHVPRA